MSRPLFLADHRCRGRTDNKWLTPQLPCSDCVRNDTDIVDQPRAADGRRGDQTHLASGFAQGFQRGGIDQGDIIDLEETGVDQRLLGVGQNAPDQLAGNDTVPRYFQGLR